MSTHLKTLQDFSRLNIRILFDGKKKYLFKKKNTFQAPQKHRYIYYTFRTDWRKSHLCQNTITDRDLAINF